MSLALTCLAAVVAPPMPMVVAHTMPWFEGKNKKGEWGWHWTMGAMNPDKRSGTRQEAASHYRPLFGLYDSHDKHLVDAQIQLMKLSGIGGVAADWYGIVDHYDYAAIHQATERLMACAQRANLKFAVVYEDQTLRPLVAAGKVGKGKEAEHGKTVVDWLRKKWFKNPNYIRDAGKPLMMVFGPQVIPESAWPSIVGKDVALYTLHHKRIGATGLYDWPLPKDAFGERKKFTKRAKGLPSIPVVFPRFHDYYKEAKLHDSYGYVPDDGGKTFRRTLEDAMKSGAKFVQIATWNDWGEGTQIEPSVEFGYRDLEVLQRATRAPYKPADLRLPIQIYLLRKRMGDNPTLLEASNALYKGDVAKARKLLATVH